MSNRIPRSKNKRTAKGKQVENCIADFQISQRKNPRNSSQRNHIFNYLDHLRKFIEA